MHIVSQLYILIVVEANKKMQAEMAAMKKAKSRSDVATPPPRIAAPSPKTTPGVTKPAKATASTASPVDRPPPPTEGARLNRLRRLCEVKPSGKCQVPPAIHERWKHANKEERESMLDELEAANWSKDL